MKTTVYVACHKPFQSPFRLSDPFRSFLKEIEVGSFFHQSHFCDLRDDEKDSISRKNDTYNELTAQYWIWKNDHESDIVGLCHYRRYFRDPGIREFLPIDLKLLRPAKIKSVLKDHDLIGIRTGPFEMSCRERIDTPVSALRPKDIPVVKRIIRERYGDLYAEAFDMILDRNWNYLYNMFIAKKDLFDSYSAWLFPILEDLEKQVDQNELAGQEKRIFGLWGEYLLNVYLEANHLKVFDCDFIYTGSE